MNLTFLIGSILAWGLVIFGIIQAALEAGFTAGGGLMMFVNPPGILIVIGGTIATLAASFPGSTLKSIPKFAKIVLFPPKFNPVSYIDQIDKFAVTARSKGLLALEDGAATCSDPFLKQAIMLIVDANDPDKVRAMLEDSIEFTTDRHAIAWNMCDKGMALSPAFGMVGTIIGLIIMLASLAANPDALGQLMAVALVTTFYGSVIANAFFAPIRSTLKNTHDKEVFCMQLVVEGVMSIAAGSNPRLIKEKLEFMLAKSEVKGEAAKEG
ncbi:MAG: MotA/TolQ/ExbB proton channel family protein [Oscillospiraceae bacterium]|nr:MotA/TolQ/ExbB proton channel family protein [Oscillospiraceae bacterium]